MTAPTFPPGRYGRRRSPRSAPRWVVPVLAVGVVAIGRPVRRPDGSALAGISISMPSVRYDPHRLRSYVATLGLAVTAVEAELREAG